MKKTALLTAIVGSVFIAGPLAVAADATTAPRPNLIYVMPDSKKCGTATAACSVPGALDVGGVATTTGGVRTNTMSPITGSSVTATVTRSLDADRADRADLADLATRAIQADAATTALQANYATEALRAATAAQADLATRATAADTATIADRALLADRALISTGPGKLIFDGVGLTWNAEGYASGLLLGTIACPPPPNGTGTNNAIAINSRVIMCLY